MTNKLLVPVSEVKGIGEKIEAQLNELGIFTVHDLIEYAPFRYEDYRLRDLSEVRHDERITIEGKVHSEPSVMYFGRRKSRTVVRLLAGNVLIKIVWFNQPYLKNKFEINQIITVTGKWDQHRQTLTAQTWKVGSSRESDSFQPVYPIKGDIKVFEMRKWIQQAMKQFSGEIDEFLPEYMLKKYKLLNRRRAFLALHLPQNEQDLKQARRRFVYEEFLLFQLKIQSLRKIEKEQSGGKPIAYSTSKLKDFMNSLPFELTSAQKKVVKEILSDLKSPTRMNRLLQGDVGSGKTVVAAIALFAASTAGFQGALMVPTEILAEQHANSLFDLLQPHGVEVALLTGAVKGKKRKELLERLKAGEINVLIGTHALIQDDVEFANLGLVVTDEQHRFGVEQRKILREKGYHPDVLFMTATPIPRTLAITAFGEMDVSTIDQMPAGRKQIETYWAKPNQLDRILIGMEKELQQGQQAYVICPLIEESDKLDVQNAIDVHALLSQHFHNRYKVGLMHGRLTSDEKDEVMRAFAANEVQVLVSTTVVEVGVNVPNATFMLIYDAERFGLSQLHQLRGRVGRGEHQSYCILLADPKGETGQERMKIMTETTNGFELSERDLELRGPGDFFGKKQSGLPEFKYADMIHDYRALETARSDAAQLIESKAFWESEEFRPLLEKLEESGAFAAKSFD
ncbi:ATP-dependent DNA helicase RecG [Bacillus carboniphilus]|uniref:ATP-dependent DNA helicase RecG n=1 Tax=Bacillus carboniphilus TaxID=86663 RepID=UPI0031DE9207